MGNQAWKEIIKIYCDVIKSTASFSTNSVKTFGYSYANE